MVSIPDQWNIRQQIQNLCGKGYNYQALDDDFGTILDSIEKKIEANE